MGSAVTRATPNSPAMRGERRAILRRRRSAVRTPAPGGRLRRRGDLVSQRTEDPEPGPQTSFAGTKSRAPVRRHRSAVDLEKELAVRTRELATAREHLADALEQQTATAGRAEGDQPLDLRPGGGARHPGQVGRSTVRGGSGGDLPLEGRERISWSQATGSRRGSLSTCRPCRWNREGDRWAVASCSTASPLISSTCWPIRNTP